MTTFGSPDCGLETATYALFTPHCSSSSRQETSAFFWRTTGGFEATDKNITAVFESPIRATSRLVGGKDDRAAFKKLTVSGDRSGTLITEVWVLLSLSLRIRKPMRWCWQISGSLVDSESRDCELDVCWESFVCHWIRPLSGTLLECWDSLFASPVGTSNIRPRPYAETRTEINNILDFNSRHCFVYQKVTICNYG